MGFRRNRLSLTPAEIRAKHLRSKGYPGQLQVASDKQHRPVPSIHDPSIPTRPNPGSLSTNLLPNRQLPTCTHSPCRQQLLMAYRQRRDAEAPRFVRSSCHELIRVDARSVVFRLIERGGLFFRLSHNILTRATPYSRL